MFLNSNKMFFMFILIFSTLISISSNSWFGCWIGLEINLLSFIPLISNSNNLLMSEASLKYFLTQSIASINLLFSILMKMILLKNFDLNNFLSIMINSSLLMKMGSAPFHFWFPNIVEGLSWFNNFILMSWQKITPMILLSYYMNNNFLLIMMMINIMIGAIGGLNQTSLRKLMAYSSINNLGWMIFAITISENLWIFYFTTYSFLISIMIFMFYNLNMFFINQLFINNMNSMIKINLFVNFLSLGGLPPFIGFLPKWIIINFLINNKMFLLSFIFIMMSLIMLFFYIRIIYSSLMFNYIKMKWFKTYFKNNFLLFTNFMSIISILGIILSTFLFF
uniref:NADH-ubiquinone oxidoreductase chain 2 n=2 Tax=Dendrolimus TaxID=151303 RepID=A0A0G2R746_9NEOP|nr:NADH dehydrogenase subunit 2 [Dendrolimus tabulaeformis]AIQ80161.1 NADH dehydrogenase subunit 2 [Dendrolimus punctatus wenshanensis]UKG18923.1 NADH dehydrogenase subunit 2 [Dendrolimus punctatus]AIQ80174.1 NADH dehydrogenase subunit 2 [Dendrolimus punctatus wenshanensis]AIQ80239.1 NADH dehydrogenase subunit 2 [Dendrolimus tabulaeformis]AIQ80252.1 NADH dehydrogenase subunit 2 [Dendrolimus tabulaeformis]